jgi:hypothetical protein
VVRQAAMGGRHLVVGPRIGRCLCAFPPPQNGREQKIPGPQEWNRDSCAQIQEEFLAWQWAAPTKGGKLSPDWNGVCAVCRS